MGKPVKIPDALEARIDAKLDAFKGDKNDDTTHRRIAHVIEEELLQWQREHPRFVIPTPHVLAEDRTIRIDYTEHRGDESTPAPPPTIDAVRFLRIAPAPAGPELPPEPIVPSALVFTVCRGHALAVDWHGTDLHHWIDDQGMRDTLTEIDATARPDGVYVWRGKIRSTYYSHTGEHDSWLEGKVEPLADDELEQLATNNGDPWDEDAIAAHVEWTFKVSELERTDIDRVKEALTDYAHATGRRVQPVHEVAAACDQDRREAVAARDAALEERWRTCTPSRPRRSARPGSMRRLYIDEAVAALEQLAAALRAGGPVPDVALAASASGAAPPTLSSAVDSIGRGYAERLLETPREDWSSIGTDLIPRSLQPALETIADARAALASLPSDLDMFAVRRSVEIDEKREPR